MKSVAHPRGGCLIASSGINEYCVQIVADSTHDMTSITELTDKIRAFAEERDWDQFHSPKNLSMAMAVEASEILELFQWLTEEQSLNLPEDKLAQLRDEIGDVAIYLLRLSDKFGIDPIAAAEKKLATNVRKYPADKVHGSAKKYNEYD